MARVSPARLLAPLLALGAALPLTTSVAVVPAPQLAPAATSPASAGQWELLTVTNKARAAAHLPALRLSAALSQNLANTWARHMADAGAISHNPDLRAAMDRYAPHWTVIGENVGVGSAVSDIQTALMNSPGHRANILDANYNYVGLGVLSSGGRVWIVEDFAATGDALSTLSSPTPQAPSAPHAVGVVNPGVSGTVLTVPGGHGPVTLAAYPAGGAVPSTTHLGGTAIGGAAGTQLAADRVIAIRGGNNAVYVRWQRNGTWDSRWTSLGGVATATPAVASTPDGRIAVLIRGGNHRLYVRWYAAGRWAAHWTALGGLLSSGLSATPTSDGLRVALVGAQGAVYTRGFHDKSGWDARFASLGGVTHRAPAAASADSGRTVHLFVVGTDGALYLKNLVDGRWDTRWRRLGGVLQSAPAANAGSDGTATVWGYGGGGHTLYEGVLAGTGWSGWHRR